MFWVSELRNQVMSVIFNFQFGLCVFAPKPLRIRKDGHAGVTWLGMRRACACAVWCLERVLVCPQGTNPRGKKEGSNREEGGETHLNQLRRLGGVREEAQRRLRVVRGTNARKDRRVSSSSCAAPASRYPQLRLSGSRATARCSCQPRVPQ